MVQRLWLHFIMLDMSRQMVPDETLIAIAEATGTYPFPNAVDMVSLWEHVLL